MLSRNILPHFIPIPLVFPHFQIILDTNLGYFLACIEKFGSKKRLVHVFSTNPNKRTFPTFDSISICFLILLDHFGHEFGIFFSFAIIILTKEHFPTFYSHFKPISFGFLLLLGQI